MTKPPISSVIETSAFDPVARVDPHPRLKEMQSACPVYRDEDGKIWFLTKYEDVRAMVNDRSLWRHPSRVEEGSLSRRFVEDERLRRNQEGEEGQDSILFMDEPDHSRVRLPLAKAFYSRINTLKPEIEEIIDRVIARAPDRGRFDLIAQIAIPIPILVIARILGVEEDRVDEFRAWSEASILGLNPMRSEEETELMEWGSAQLTEYFTHLMGERRKAPKNDLISDMVALQADGAPLSDEEVRINLSALLIGGNLTTTDLIGNGVWLFMTHPDQFALLKADANLAAAAVEEILRYESPVAITTRVMSETRDVGGCPMKAHQSMMMSLHAANRDPDAFDDPDRFDITRKHVSHVAFGGGFHICIGSPLARIEAQRAFVKLFERYPDMQLAGDPIEWRALPFFRGIEALWVTV